MKATALMQSPWRTFLSTPRRRWLQRRRHRETPDLVGTAAATPDLSRKRPAHNRLPTARSRRRCLGEISGRDPGSWRRGDEAGPHPEADSTLPRSAFRAVIVGDFGKALDAAAGIVGVSENHQLLEACGGGVGRGSWDGQRPLARSQLYYLDTRPIGSPTRAPGSSNCRSCMGVPAAEIAVIGDGGNDVLMFEASWPQHRHGQCRAGGQGSGRLRTDSNAEDGFARAIERFILGGER